MRDASAAGVLQLTVRPAMKGTTLRLHAERLADADDRAAVISCFHALLDDVAAEAACSAAVTELS